MKYTISFLLIFTIQFFSCTYLPEESIELSAFNYEETPDYIQISPREASQNIIKNIFVFYPGGLVDPHAYTKILTNLFPIIDEVVILKVDGNLAITELQKARKIIETIRAKDNIIQGALNRFIVGGHSLGGVAACSLENKESVAEGIILFASYPTANTDLVGYEGRVLSITGTDDGVFDFEIFEERKSNFPTGVSYDEVDDLPSEIGGASTTYFSLQGGNHANFGSYGNQKGDGEGSLSEEEQHQLIRELFASYFIASKWN